MSVRPDDGRPPGPPPPARPQVAFRPPPSAVLARRPSVVSASAVLWAVAGVLVGLAALLMLLDLDGVRGAVRTVVDTGFASVPAEKRQRVVGLTTTVLVVGAAVGVAQVLLARSLWAGRGVRFVLVLLLVLAAVELVLAVGVVDLAVRLALVVGVMSGVAAAVLMYLPDANLWFAMRRP